MYCFITSLIISLFSLITYIVMIFSNEESMIVELFGNTEVFICLGISLVLIIIGWVTDKRDGYCRCG